VAPVIREAATITGEDPYRLSGLLYRESWCGWAPGYRPKGSWDGWGDDPDGPLGPITPHAFGLCQIDRRWHRPFIDSAHAKDPLKQVLYACDLLRENRLAFGRSALSLRGDELERAVYASYNAGFGRVYHEVITGRPHRGDPDAVTTGKNYSRWIFGLADAFRGLAPDLYPGKNT
jgi:hypothetical protein